MDDFIVVDGKMHYTVPTVPLNKKYLKTIDISGSIQLESDDDYRDKIKWYVNPIIIGGGPTDKENMVFINIEQHVEIVNWWNNNLIRKI